MNHPHDWLQFGLYVGALLLLTKPLGLHLVQVLDVHRRTWLDPVVRPLERLTYRVCRIDPEREQHWTGYALSLLAFSLVGMLCTYCILRVQDRLPLNPSGLPAVAPALAFNTAASFVTNTDWQNYAGEATMSYFSQMVALAFHHWTSAAVGIAIAAALVRGVARRSATTIGNFWADLIRITYHVLVPLSFLLSLFLVSQGVIQNFKPYTAVKTCESPGTGTQIIVQGPMASQISIKMLGTNGGGYTNANAAHPFENPTPLSNFVQMLAIFALGSALTYYLGREVRNQRHGWAVWSAMFVLFVVGALVVWRSEAAGNPIHHQLGVAVGDGNMEGKEVRFGVFNSALFATITTAASCGAVNAMHDSFTPLGGLMLLFNLQIGEVIFGGVGVGLAGMLIFVVLAVFIAGLMVGRTPEYLGKKIEARDVKLVMLVLIVLAATTLGGTAWAAASTWGRAGPTNAGPHGFSEILYLYSSCLGNNGSAFAGLTGNPANGDWHYNVTGGLAMLIGRFLLIIPVLALAGNLAAKQQRPASAGTLRTEGVIFIVLLVGTVVLLGALAFLPSLAIGPIVEHYLMHSGTTF